MSAGITGERDTAGARSLEPQDDAVALRIVEAQDWPAALSQQQRRQQAIFE
jgi:hypothetical protein